MDMMEAKDALSIKQLIIRIHVKFLCLHAYYILR